MTACGKAALHSFVVQLVIAASGSDGLLSVAADMWAKLDVEFGIGHTRHMFRVSEAAILPGITALCVNALTLD